MEISKIVVDHRRYLHMHPELGFEEYETAKYIRNHLDRLGIPYKTAGTGTIGYMDVGSNETIALRADIDALPINEMNDKPYASKNPGKMHACGHDAHTAMLLTAAEYMVVHKPSKNVRFIFQPSEEGGCGACEMVKAGAVDGVDSVFGIHVWIGTESGRFAVKSGPLMAGVDEMTLRVKGSGGHAASPNQTVNPISIGSTIINELMKMRSLRVDPLDSAVLNVTAFNSGNAFNVVPVDAKILGTIRTFSDKVRDEIISNVEKMRELSKSLGGDLEVKINRIAPPLVNFKESTEYAIKTLERLGFQYDEATPTMGSEDFAYYLKEVKGSFVFLGIRSPSKNIIAPHHSPYFDVDEDVLEMGVKFFLGLVGSI
ncbi:M20 metallopeptidase family protein [Athalassotoga saccharophila]|uniref:M20 metallopeptidase family protein n=1 Tax=Athalassotoga saccharophila TaxID=1441386 RepID=UPI0013795071|nr:M20 family metallopeptidase [Athalassotoga saccharophila]BBJ28560.1 N-acetyl-L,L-diaminopimelate deacetylase [Athalassotoga saccharophila]